MSWDDLLLPPEVWVGTQFTVPTPRCAAFHLYHKADDFPVDTIPGVAEVEARHSLLGDRKSAVYKWRRIDEL